MSSSIGRDQGLSSSIAVRDILPFLSILGFLLEVKSQGNNLFEKHKAIIYILLLLLFPFMLEQLFLVKSLGQRLLGPFNSSLAQLPQSYSY